LPLGFYLQTPTHRGDERGSRVHLAPEYSGYDVPMLEIFIDVVLPVFLMAGAGAAVRAFRKISVEPISYVTLYIFSPCLAFHSLANTTLPGEELVKIGLFAVVLAMATYILSKVAARGMKLDRETTSAFLLTSLFMNSGNYGLPVALFAFGQEGLDRALVFFVAQFALAGTLAVFIASSSQHSLKGSLISVMRVPLIYASVAGVGVNVLAIDLPLLVGGPIRILGNAAVPSMLIVLGLQLAEPFALGRPIVLVATCFIRLVVAGGIAYAVTLVFGFGDVTQKVLIVIASMPTAVLTIIVATEFRVRPNFVTSAVVVSTLASLFTLTMILSLIDRFL